MWLFHSLVLPQPFWCLLTHMPYHRTSSCFVPVWKLTWTWRDVSLTHVNCIWTRYGLIWTLASSLCTNWFLSWILQQEWTPKFLDIVGWCPRLIVDWVAAFLKHCQFKNAILLVTGENLIRATCLQLMVKDYSGIFFIHWNVNILTILKIILNSVLYCIFIISMNFILFLAVRRSNIKSNVCTVYPKVRTTLAPFFLIY